jgi:hypothetical protein
MYSLHAADRVQELFDKSNVAQAPHLTTFVVLHSMMGQTQHAEKGV